ncbi:hypothetical protein MRX96_007539 [Rhipicephalus microplus]
MIACARSYFWWPDVDSDIEEVAKNCVTCRQQQKAPGKAPTLQWERATLPWYTIHADLAGPVEGRMLLVVVDAYTKWLERVALQQRQQCRLSLGSTLHVVPMCPAYNMITGQKKTKPKEKTKAPPHPSRPAAAAMAATTGYISSASASTAQQLQEKQAVSANRRLGSTASKRGKLDCFRPCHACRLYHSQQRQHFRRSCPRRNGGYGHHCGLAKASRRAERGVYSGSRQALPCAGHCGDFTNPRNTSPD